MKLHQYLNDKNIRPTHFAAEIGVAPSTVTRWLRGERKPSAEMAVLAERKTGVPRSMLRPDIFGEAA